MILLKFFNTLIFKPNTQTKITNFITLFKYISFNEILTYTLRLGTFNNFKLFTTWHAT